MVTYGFFNSVNGDRKYDADQMSQYFKGLIGNGVFESVGSALAVSAGSGMNVEVASGRGVIECKWINNDATIEVPITGSHATLPRYTAVVMRLDKINREMKITTIDGTPAITPVKPSLSNTDTMKDLCLAWVYVPAGSSSISGSNIEDARSTSACGWVTGLVTQLDVSNLYTQWVDLFNAYYEDMNTSFDAWFRDLAGELRVQTSVRQYIKTIIRASESDSTTYTFSAQGYVFSGNDIINVYINGLRANPDSDYYVGTTGSSWRVTVPYAKAVGTEIMIEVYKSQIGFNALGISGEVRFIDDQGRIIRV